MMFERFANRLLPVLLSGVIVAQSVQAAEQAAASVSASSKSEKESIRPLSPGPADGRIAFVTAKMLEQLQYDRKMFQDPVSSAFLDQYLESLDPQHIHFLQSDIEEFEKYRTSLDQLTTPRTQVADTRPAYHIFNRFQERLQQRVEYADQVLKGETFTFEGTDKISVNRKELPYPKDMNEAKKLWRERLKFEYLQEKMGKIEAKKKAEKDERLKNAPAASEAKNGKVMTDDEKIIDTLSHRYHRNLRAFKDWDNDDVLQVYLTTLARVYDPHSDYFGAEQLDSFSIGMNLTLYGIGAELTSEDGYCTIRRLLPGGPAEKSKKIKVKDRIVAVAQSNQPPVDVVDMALNKAVQLIRGPKGSEVTLTLIPAGSDERILLSLVRDEIKLDDQAAKAKLIELPGSDKPMRVGVIDLPSFYASFDPGQTRGKDAVQRSTSADVSKLISRLKQENVDGIILDLRRNGGGSLEEAIRVTGLFIKEGPVVQVRDAEGGVMEDRDDDPAMLYDGPLMVLTSRFSASASEIVAGALQDYGRAVVVGDSATHGKGTVQSVNTLKPFMRLGNIVWTNEPGALKVTIKKFYRASGASTQLKGVVPDIVLPSVMSYSKDIGESALDNPMPWDTIPTAEFDRLSMVEPFAAELRKRSVQRVLADRDFDYIREDIEHFKKMQEDRTVSLNLQERLREKEEAEARQKARDAERRARKESKEKVYEFTLKNVDVPGLPTPVEKTNEVSKAHFSPADSEATAVTSAAGGDTAELDEEKAPAVDPVLTEAERIMIDYVGLLRNSSVLTAGQPRT